jgi:hypothetical protein
LILLFTAYYPQKDDLFNIWVLAGVLREPVFLVAGVAGFALIWIAAQRSGDAKPELTLDRLLVYAAAVMVMAGLAIVACGQPTYVYRLITALPAADVAVIAAAIAMLLRAHRETMASSRSKARSSHSPYPVLLMTSIKGWSIGLTQFAEGARAAVTSYTPERWERCRPLRSTTMSSISMRPT